jgi:signal transduction histidine kinase
MPGLNGFEGCRRRKSDARVASIPILLLCVLDEPAEKRRAFEVGGADYVGKPFHAEEIVARVSHQVQLARLQRDMRVANARLRELDRVKATFTAMLVHDLRSPLAAAEVTLRQLTELLGDSVDEELRDLATLSGESLQGALSLISELLEIYRGEQVEVPPVLAPLDLGDVVRRAVAAASINAKRRRVTLASSVKDRLAIRGDKRRLARAFTNLVTNALKFTSAGGRVDVDAHIVATGDATHVRAIVRDTGYGIAEEEVPHLFELYRQAEIGRSLGFGLGLAITKRILDAHGATIGVETRLGVGTTFTIDFPLAASIAS